jgi:CRP-like cAMP-binding protein
MRGERLAADDEAVLRTAVGRLGLHDEYAITSALRLLRAYRLSRREHLLVAGQHATWAGLLVSGLLREYFVSDKGVERTKSIVTPLQFTGSLADLLGGEPSRANIVAEEPSRLLLAPWSELRALEQASPAWAALQRRSLEHLLLYKAQREYQFLCLDAEARYAAFLQRHPDLEARVAAHDIASYLGITPVHLSRLRARRLKHRKLAASTS